MTLDPALDELWADRPTPGPLAEARHARLLAALFRLDDRREIAISGVKAAKMLQGQVTNDVLALSPGQGCHAAHLDAKGRMITDLVLQRTSDEDFIMTVPAAEAPGLLTRFQRFAFLDDCEVTDRSERRRLLALVGPASGEAVDLLASGSVSGAEDSYACRHWLTPWGDVDATALPETGERAWMMNVPEATARAIADALHAVPMVELGSDEAWEILRIEAGTPRWGVDMDTSNLAPECNLAHAISYTKGCYVGQETVARVKTYGQVSRALRGLTSETVLPVGAELFDGDGKSRGRVSSSARSAVLERPIALAMVHRSVHAPGTELVARAEDFEASVIVVALPHFEGPFRP
ncbi:MAG: aminomethyltransferase family protein [Planctomycetes bacterium]|nr:aminomethyltransferase family protein [Planctomycetota bacterium]